MGTETFLVRTMSDTVETDIQRVLTITTEMLPKYGMHPLPFERLRKIADGPFDLFLIPLVFAQEYATNHNLIFNEKKRLEIRTQPCRSHETQLRHKPPNLSGNRGSLKASVCRVAQCAFDHRRQTVST